MSDSSNSRLSYNNSEIKERIRFLDVRPEDFAGCSSLDQEFIVILRKTGDLKAFSDPSEVGFARRIREINKAHRALAQMYHNGEIGSFSDFLREDTNDDSSQNQEDEKDQHDADHHNHHSDE